MNEKTRDNKSNLVASKQNLTQEAEIDESDYYRPVGLLNKQNAALLFLLKVDETTLRRAIFDVTEGEDGDDLLLTAIRCRAKKIREILFAFDPRYAELEELTVDIAKRVRALQATGAPKNLKAGKFDRCARAGGS